MENKKRASFRFNKFRILIIIALIIAVMIGISIYIFYNLLLEDIADWYAIIQTSDMVIDYMENNNGQWPNDWNDLKPSYDRISSGGDDYNTFEEIKNRINIDFKFDPKKYLEAKSLNESYEEKMIYLRMGSMPEEKYSISRIYEYLKSKERKRRYH